MVMGRGVAGAFVAVGEDREAEVGVFVEHLALRDALGDVGADKLLVLEDVFEEVADLLAALRTGLGAEELFAFGRKLIEGALHGENLLEATRHAAGSLIRSLAGRESKSRMVVRGKPPPRF